MNSAWMSYRRLSKNARHDLLLGFVLVPLAVVFVRLFGVGRWRRVEEERERADGELEGPNTTQINEARAEARMIEAASRHGIARGNCLSRSVALWWLLRRKGINAELRIGARRAGEGLEAHAWVELGGTILNDEDDVRESFAIFEGPLASRVAARK
ncbi:MAG TPA: lasso peptide biosynthesis B2 protein [Candidatus Acidoferrales bacterium]|nr:lasso peptide biosynthesis B2 protein [Candidatus Acidoferrales bacterium]